MTTTAATVTPHAEMVAFMRQHGGFVGALNYLIGAAQEIGGKDARLACAFGEWIADRRTRFELMLPAEILEEYLDEVRNIRGPEW